MAEPNSGSVGTLTADCPVCGKKLVVDVIARKVIHTKVFQGEDRVEHSGRLQVLIDYDTIVDKIGDHAVCFEIDDDVAAALEVYDLQMAAARAELD